MEDQPLEKIAGGIFEGEVSSIFPNDDCSGNPPGVVDGKITVGVDDIEWVEACPKRGVELHPAERVQDTNILPETIHIVGASAAAAGGDSRVFALGVDDNGRTQAKGRGSG
jgi:hypothetical protein